MAFAYYTVEIVSTYPIPAHRIARVHAGRFDEVRDSLSPDMLKAKEVVASSPAHAIDNIWAFLRKNHVEIVEELDA